MALTIFPVLDINEEFGPNTSVIVVLKAIYTASPPRLLDVHDLVLERLQSLYSDECDQLVEVVREKRDAFFAIAKIQSEKWKSLHIEETGWIAPYLKVKVS